MYDSVVTCLFHYVLYQSDVVYRVVFPNIALQRTSVGLGTIKNGCVTLCVYSILVVLAAF